jgi:hypothetical protein
MKGTRFIHIEDPIAEIGKLLSDMMSLPVLVVPSLAQVPASATAQVYVCTNGPKGTGPLGFQPDLFPKPPGTDGYTSLCAIHLVTSNNESQKERPAQDGATGRDCKHVLGHPGRRPTPDANPQSSPSPSACRLLVLTRTRRQGKRPSAKVLNDRRMPWK